MRGKRLRLIDSHKDGRITGPRPFKKDMPDIARQFMVKNPLGNYRNRSANTTKTGVFLHHNKNNTPKIGALKGIFSLFCTPKIGDYSRYTSISRFLICI